MYHDSGFQKCIHEKEIEGNCISEISETVSYFNQRNVLERYMKQRLIPKDYARIYMKTVGIVERTVCGVTCFDTGGQRCERSRWEDLITSSECKHCFVISLSQCNELCYELSDLNRFDDSYRLFQSVLERKEIKRLYVIFTKFEVLREKIRRGYKLSSFFKDFKGNDSDPNEVKDFIIEKFLNLDRESKIAKHFVVDCCFHRESLVGMFNEVVGRPAFDMIDLNFIPTPSEVDKWLDKVDPNWKVNIPTTRFTNLMDAILSKPEIEIIWTARPLKRDEILSVSEFFDLDDILNMRLVCREFNGIMNEGGIRVKKPNLELFMKTPFKYVKFIDLQSCFLTSDIFQHLVKDDRFKSLEYLDLSNNYLLKEEDFEYFFENQQFRNLKILKMDFCNFSNLSAISDCKFPPKLQSLSLNGVKNLNISDLSKLVDNLGNTLTELNVIHSNLDISQIVNSNISKKLKILNYSLVGN
ncbi:predicted protein [Naegleria gruberi]|uniref:Predicted protein n=1 Tax=Naegleria gruberi TaxID=5762 RepID=D2VY36_NAEGR|nr:uncharacterized protein NAEGRDRAFT_73957 [Naegleria gruberi]EFC38295.1 predicted protein [Naegleria gruberi]|eukprot:XP_002671039.1 predicted protein [Naegleria gruberi strain NEG-M]